MHAKRFINLLIGILRPNGKHRLGRREVGYYEACNLCCSCNMLCRSLELRQPGTKRSSIELRIYRIHGRNRLLRAMRSTGRGDAGRRNRTGIV